MIRTILIWLAVVIALILVVLWFVTGGVGKTVQAARGIASSFNLGLWSASSSQFRLPWQPEDQNLNALIELTGTDDESGTQTTEDELSDAEREYEELRADVEEARTFGEPSPQRGSANLGEGGATEEAVAREYLVLEASIGNTAPINLAGWSLQSALTGKRMYIPRGAELFISGNVNAQQDIALNPGAAAIVSSGASPVGSSFRVNRCSGYLGALQTFVPALSRDCPAPAESLPLTPENLKNYGDACYDYVQTLPACLFPQETPPELLPACRTFLSNTLSYNGCVQEYQYRSDFKRDSWRIYQNANVELWRNTHDIIRLLDAEGKTVDVVSY